MKQRMSFVGSAVASAMSAPANPSPAVLSSIGLGVVTGRSSSQAGPQTGVALYTDPTSQAAVVLNPDLPITEQVSVRALEILRSGQALHVPSTPDSPARILVMVNGEVRELIPVRKSIG